VILTYLTMLIPFCAWLLLGYFKTVPKELEEAPNATQQVGAAASDVARQLPPGD
jgi:ABC-type maltose transport system permease subunit